MKGRNLGKALTMIHRWMVACEEDEEFGAQMGAPMGELRHLINRGRCKELRRLRRRVKALTGLRWRVFVGEVERRTSARWVHFHSAIPYAEQFLGWRENCQ